MEELSEKEQLDLMRSWWAENGRYVIGGVALGIALLFGWNRWQTGIADAQIEASTMYEEVMTEVGEGDVDAAAAAADRLFGGHPGSAYAAQGRLAMARLYMDNGRDQDAAEVLRVLVDSGANSELALVARLRLAKVLLYQDKAAEVVSLVEDHLDTAFGPLMNEVLGDAQVALGDFEAAGIAYTDAVAALATSGADTSLLQLKINDLPEVTDGSVEIEVDAGEEATEGDVAEGDDAGSEQPPAEDDSLE